MTTMIADQNNNKKPYDVDVPLVHDRLFMRGLRNGVILMLALLLVTIFAILLWGWLQ